MKRLIECPGQRVGGGGGGCVVWAKGLWAEGVGVGMAFYVGT